MLPWESPNFLVFLGGSQYSPQHRHDNGQMIEFNKLDSPSDFDFLKIVLL